MARGKKPEAKPADQAAKKRRRTGPKPRTVRTPKKDPNADAKAAFLKAMSEGKSITGSADAAGIARSTAYQWRDEDETFAAAWDDAIEAGTDRLEDEAHRRAFEGVARSVAVGKEIVDVVDYSDTLTIFLLKGRRPEKFRENVKVDHAGRVDVAVAGAKDALNAKLQKLTEG